MFIHSIFSRLSARWRWWLVAIMLMNFIIGVGSSTVFRAAFDVKIRTDLSVYRLAGVGALEGQDLYTIQNERSWFFTSPPIVAILCIPLAFASLMWDAVWVYLVSLLLLGAVVFLTTRIIPEEILEKKWSIIGSSLLVSSIFFMDVATRGQFGILLLFCLMVTLYGWLKNKPLLAGLFLGFAVSIKITPALLLLPFFFFKRAWHILAWTLASTVLFTFLIPGLYFGFAETVEYLTTWVLDVPLTAYQIPPNQDQFYSGTYTFWRQIHDPFIARNQSFYAVFSRLLLQSRKQMVEFGIGRPRLLGHAASLLMLAISLPVWFKKTSSWPKSMIAFSTPLMVLLASSTLAWTHYFSVLFIAYVAAFTAYWQSDNENRGSLRIYTECSIVLMVLGYTVPQIRFAGGLLWSVVCLWIGFVQFLYAKERATTGLVLRP